MLLHTHIQIFVQDLMLWLLSLWAILTVLNFLHDIWQILCLSSFLFHIIPAALFSFNPMLMGSCDRRFRVKAQSIHSALWKYQSWIFWHLSLKQKKSNNKAQHRPAHTAVEISDCNILTEYLFLLICFFACCSSKWYSVTQELFHTCTVT